MTTYAVIRTVDGAEIYRYQADAPIEWAGCEFASHQHVEVPNVVVETMPRPPVVWSQTEFLKRFEIAERIAARDRAKTDPFMDDLWGLLTSSPVVHSNDPDVVRGLGYMVQIGLLTVERRNQIIGDAE